MRKLISVGGALLLAGGFEVAIAAAQLSNTSKEDGEKTQVLRIELIKRINELKGDLKVAKDLTAPKKSPERQQFPWAAYTVRGAEPRPLRAAPPTRIEDNAEQERRDTARALERLQLDTRLDRNRKLDELLLERLR